MIDFDAVLRLVQLEADELEHWIAERWVLPERTAGGYLFHEVDVARIHLIVELRRELLIDEEAMPLVLNLLDQIYALRRRLKSLLAAIDTLPEEMRTTVRARLAAEPTEEC